MAHDINQLRRGSIYWATTEDAIAVGEYLGLETLYGDTAILLRHPLGIESIALTDVTSIWPAAA
jgi:hypothetical protein